ncbi:MAG: tRNA (adenosine(37)-N6)-dimethylallyltransferase MiaA [Clostridiales Family XIII bacterium]|jgi:tRNA dimethylallyltransferase|nr:tRNA (adenosine(37)-N6)-dimethylallyltransferase MiaA [Clostridiales Family XIII bacterium]
MDILVIVGPTAVGKTEYAIEQAVKFDGEIISADATQIYKGFDIGSAKPGADERARAVHHLIDFADPFKEFSVADYQKMALEAIRDVGSRGKLPILSGGTGLYVNAVVYDMDFSMSPKQEGFRQQLYDDAKAFGADFVHEKLRRIDPAVAGRIHPNNLKKTIRALEILAHGGALRSFEESFKLRDGLNPRIIGLTRKREELYRRVDLRVDRIIESGLADEVKGLAESGLTEDNIAMKGIGYKEFLGYFRGEYSLEQTIYLIKRNSKRYAKRQMTWFRRYADVTWVDLSEGEA